VEYILIGGIHYPKECADEFADHAIRLASLTTYPSGQKNVWRDYSLIEAFMNSGFILTEHQRTSMEYALTHPLYAWGMNEYMIGRGGGYCRAYPREPKMYGYSLVAPKGSFDKLKIWVADPDQAMWTSAIPSNYYHDVGEFYFFRPTDYDPVEVPVEEKPLSLVNKIVRYATPFGWFKR
jgi:hypothetical protein